MQKVTDLPIFLPRSHIPDNARGLSTSGKYHPKALLGEGAAGAVYLVHRFLDSGDFVPDLFAIKILCPLQQIARTERGLSRIAARFRAETLRGRKLSHPHLIKITDYGYIHGGGSLWDGARFYAMPFVEGDALNTLFKNSAPPIHERHRWTIELTDAVAYLHSLNISHRDIKPHNIMITKNSRQLILGDFGVIRWGDFAPEYTDGVSTYSGEVLTTWQYLPPEVESDPSRYNASSDAWSLGKTLLEILSWETGKRIDILTGYKNFGQDKPPILMDIVQKLVEDESYKRPAVRDVLSNLVDYQESIINHIELVRNMGGIAAKNIAEIAESIRHLYYSRQDICGIHKYAKWEEKATCDVCGSSSIIWLGTFPISDSSFDYFNYVCAGTENHSCGNLQFWSTEDDWPPPFLK